MLGNISFKTVLVPVHTVVLIDILLLSHIRITQYFREIFVFNRYSYRDDLVISDLTAVVMTTASFSFTLSVHSIFFAGSF